MGSDDEQVYVEVMVAFDGLMVGERALVPARWLADHRQYLKPLVRRRWVDDSSGSRRNLSAQD